jgi:hypothetical protein
VSACVRILVDTFPHARGDWTGGTQFVASLDTEGFVAVSGNLHHLSATKPMITVGHGIKRPCMRIIMLFVRQIQCNLSTSDIISARKIEAQTEACHIPIGRVECELQYIHSSLTAMPAHTDSPCPAHAWLQRKPRPNKVFQAWNTLFVVI